MSEYSTLKVKTKNQKLDDALIKEIEDEVRTGVTREDDNTLFIEETYSITYPGDAEELAKKILLLSPKCILSIEGSVYSDSCGQNLDFSVSNDSGKLITKGSAWYYEAEFDNMFDSLEDFEGFCEWNNFYSNNLNNVYDAIEVGKKIYIIDDMAFFEGGGELVTELTLYGEDDEEEMIECPSREALLNDDEAGESSTVTLTIGGSNIGDVKIEELKEIIVEEDDEDAELKSICTVDGNIVCVIENTYCTCSVRKAKSFVKDLVRWTLEDIEELNLIAEGTINGDGKTRSFIIKYRDDNFYIKKTDWK